MGLGVGVGLGAAVGLGVGVGLGVAVGTGVAVGLGVAVGTGVAVGFGVAVGAGVAVDTGVGVGLGVVVGVGVAVAVGSGASMTVCSEAVEVGVTDVVAGADVGAIGGSAARANSTLAATVASISTEGWGREVATIAGTGVGTTASPPEGGDPWQASSIEQPKISVATSHCAIKALSSYPGVGRAIISPSASPANWNQRTYRGS